MNVQNAKSLEIEEGDVKTIHDKNGQLLWGAVGYDTKYAGNTLQNGTPTPDAPIPVQTVTGEQTVQVTGKNLWNSWAENTSRITVADDGTLLVSDVSTSNGYCDTGATLSQLAPSLSVGDTVYLYLDTDFYYAGHKREIIYVGGVTWNKGSSQVITQTMLDAHVIVYGGYQSTSHIKIMMTENELATTYEPYQGASYTVRLGSLELCKIGTYQDYIYKSGDDWYVHKETGKASIDGSVGTISRSSENRFNIDSIDLGWKKQADAIFCLANSYITVPQYTSNTAFNNNTASMKFALGLHPSANSIRIKDSNYDVLSDYTTWLSSNPISLYYVLATPTDTKITDSTLIGELEAVHEWMTRYGYQASVTGNLPMIIRQDALT